MLNVLAALWCDWISITSSITLTHPTSFRSVTPVAWLSQLQDFLTFVRYNYCKCVMMNCCVYVGAEYYFQHSPRHDIHLRRDTSMHHNPLILLFLPSIPTCPPLPPITSSFSPCKPSLSPQPCCSYFCLGFIYLMKQRQNAKPTACPVFLAQSVYAYSVQ